MNLTELARQFRAAILAGDHISAMTLAEAYGNALEPYWTNLNDADRANSQVPSTARELLTWAREATLIQRSMVGNQLTVLDKAIRYQDQTGSHAVQLRG